MFYRYQFELELYPTLDRIPFYVRMKLDLTGINISLNVWQAYSLVERWVLCHLPIETEEERKTFTSYLDFLSQRYLGEKAATAPPITDPPWEDLSQIPISVQVRGKETGHSLTLQEWSQWDRYQRYALFKLSISKNEPEQFFEALQEFRERIGHPS